MSQLFGFSIKSKSEELKGQSPVPPNADDSVTTVAGGYFGSYVDIDGIARNEFDLIRRYRDMSMHPEVDSAIDEIVNEAINSSLDAYLGVPSLLRLGLIDQKAKFLESLRT